MFDLLIKKAYELLAVYESLPEHNEEAYQAYIEAHNEAMKYSNKATIGGLEF
jgi:hypothetical protein